MIDNGMIYFAKSGTSSDDLKEKICLNPKMANRHGFVCGATGTGKTVTLKVLAESFSALGVPVFVSDVKGDVSGLLNAGTDSESMQKRIRRFDIADSFRYEGSPCTFYDIYGEKGIRLRTSVSEIGPILMSRILDLNETQSDLLSVVYKIADDHGLLLVDTKDLKATLNFAYENSAELEMEYGHIAKASVSAIVRSIVALESEGADQFFGEPAIDIKDFFTVTPEGKGMINVLDSESLINQPRLYSAFMLFLLSELFEVLPEVGDPEKPKMVFFFDEAHLLFNNASQTLLEKVNQVVKLIRSKGVGIYFVTQSPSDIPNSVMSQLSNKIEHALRAYTPAELRALKAAADTFRVNPEFDTVTLLQELGTGEAIVSLLDEKGIPQVAQHAFILPPMCSMDPISEEERTASITGSSLYTKYGQTVDPDSAYEFLQRQKKMQEQELEDMKSEAAEKKAQEEAEKEAQKAKEKEEKEAQKAAEKAEKEAQKAAEKAEKEAQKAAEKAEKEALKAQEKAAKEAEKAAKKKQNAVSQAAKSVSSTVTGTVGREVGKAIGGSIGGSFGKTLGGNIGSSLGRNIIGTLFKLK